ncbi:coiled-coil domain-containing protein [Actinocorallia populi]|uniref:hypothetical protein n=1 Tax=Actinocorallia populi TaxID=2079200 RepID=UPI000D088A91|nr:hypothetical protein [Actinocorallia populi]
MTVVLVVACLAVAGAELYLAFGRTRRDAAALSDLRASGADLAERLEAALSELHELRADLAERPEAADLARLTKRTAELGQGQDELTATLRRYDELAGYVSRVEERSGRLEGSITELRRSRDTQLTHLEAAVSALRREREEQSGRTEALVAELRAEHREQALRHEAVLNALEERSGRHEDVLAEIRHDHHEQNERFERALAELQRSREEHEALFTAASSDLRREREEQDSRFSEALAELRQGREEHSARLADALEELRRVREEQTQRVDSALAELRASGEARPAERREALSGRIDQLGDPTAPELIRAELVALRAQTDLALDRLDELDAERDRDLERYRDLAQALDAVEDQLAGQRAADPEPTTVRGGLVGATPASHEVLSKAYENFTDALDLRVRMQVPAGSSPWHIQYYLAGKNTARLRRDFLALLGELRAPGTDPRRDALHALAVELQACEQAFAQIGPLVMVRVPGALLCGVLTMAETRRFDTERFLSDPTAAATGLRLLPEPRFRDLSSWPQTA